MKFATFRGLNAVTHCEPHWGVVVGDSVVDLVELGKELSGRSSPIPRSLKDYIAASENNALELEELVQRAVNEGAPNVRRPLSEVVFLPPIQWPDKFICVGKNNRAHLEELQRSQLIKELPAEPTGFIKINSCLVGNDAEVARPPGIVEFDYEPELVFIIGSPAYRVKKSEAMRYVFGVTLLNDLTAREIQRREVESGTRFWTAKNMPGMGPVGPYVVSIDEIPDPADLWLTCAVNGETRVRVNTGEQIYQIPDIIEHFSKHLPLLPGDMFSTGSPGGVAVGKPNAAELYLKPGDLVEVTMEGVMTLRTKIV